MGSIGSDAVIRALPSQEGPPRKALALQGSAVYGSELAEHIKRLGRRGLPDYPDAGVVSELEVPPPAQLREGADAYELVRMCAAAYRSVCRWRFDRPNSFMLYGKLGSHKMYDAVLHAARMLQHFRMPPAAWALFSFDVWRERVNQRTPPTALWTFSASRIGKRRDWFERCRGEYCLRRTMPALLHQALIRDWGIMWRELLGRAPETRAEVLQVVDEFFPGDAYERRVQAARAEVTRVQRDIDLTISEGSLWG